MFTYSKGYTNVPTMYMYTYIDVSNKEMLHSFNILSTVFLSFSVDSYPCCICVNLMCYKMYGWLYYHHKQHKISVIYIQVKSRELFSTNSLIVKQISLIKWSNTTPIPSQISNSFITRLDVFLSIWLYSIWS